mgnify:CR=1 FL=1
MKTRFLFFVLIAYSFSCSVKKEIVPVQSISIIETDVNTLLDNWHKAASEANYEGYFSKMDSVSIFIGTDATENWTKEQFENFSKPYFDKGKAWSFRALDRNVYINDARNFVWFDELLATWMGTCRVSGVLEKKDEIWKIKHYVLSVEIPNNDIKAVIEVKKKSDSIFLSNFKN